MRSQNFLSTCIYIFKLLILCRENLSVSGNKMVMVLKVCFGFFGCIFQIFYSSIFFILPLHLRRIFFFKYIYFKLKDVCFTVLCWFLPYINMNRPQVYICPFSGRIFLMKRILRLQIEESSIVKKLWLQILEIPIIGSNSRGESKLSNQYWATLNILPVLRFSEPIVSRKTTNDALQIYSWTFPHPSTVRAINIFFSNTKKKVSSESKSQSVLSGSLGPHGLQPVSLLSPWNSPDENTGVGSQKLLQKILLTKNTHTCCLSFIQ